MGQIWSQIKKLIFLEIGEGRGGASNAGFSSRDVDMCMRYHGSATCTAFLMGDGFPNLGYYSLIRTEVS